VLAVVGRTGWNTSPGSFWAYVPRLKRRPMSQQLKPRWSPSCYFPVSRPYVLWIPCLRRLYPAQGGLMLTWQLAAQLIWKWLSSSTCGLASRLLLWPPHVCHAGGARQDSAVTVERAPGLGFCGQDQGPRGRGSCHPGSTASTWQTAQGEH